MRVEIGDAVLICADNRHALPTLADASVDSVVTDPPYELGFMGKSWDAAGLAFDPDFWASVARVLKPGGHLLAFGGTRTYHRMTCAIEDAGFEIRDCIMWVYGSGFPKSLDVSKAIDKAAGAEREVVGVNPNGRTTARASEAWARPWNGDEDAGAMKLTAPATDAARQWQGWGTALKPAYEPIVVARKPLGSGTVAANVLEWGTGGLNVDGCRVNPGEHVPGGGGGERSGRSCGILGAPTAGNLSEPHTAGRWPANFCHDGSEEVVALFPKESGGGFATRIYGGGKGFTGSTGEEVGFGDSGSAARFFYTAKASQSDRGKGNNHPTVKPLDLMRYLVRLVTPKGGLVLDPFLGSGTTGKAASLEGFRFIGIEREPAYFEIAKGRVGEGEGVGSLFDPTAAPTLFPLAGMGGDE